MGTDELIDLYLDLLARTLTRYDMGPDYHPAQINNPVIRRIVSAVSGPFDRRQLELNRVMPFNSDLRMVGRDYPATAETMAGIKRLENLRDCITTAIADGVLGDLLEAGVWRGGASIYMRAVLNVHGITDRVVWAADSFEGLPPPNASIVADKGDPHHLNKALAVGLDEVKANFSKYGLLDDQVNFLKGWFSQTLASAPIESLAVLRADGDMYESTMDILTSLYSKVSPGGFVIIDDYEALPACRHAVIDFRQEHGITEPLIAVDWSCVYWRRP